MRVLGIDYGAARVGVALGDTVTRLASPWTVMLNKDRADLLRRLQDLVEQEKIEAMVVGIPRPLRNRDEKNDQVRDIESFIADLRALGIVIHEEDETMSSGLAARQVQAAGEKGKRDDLAAANILQSWLDRHALSS
jgi:putative Holliday junction resolvase